MMLIITSAGIAKEATDFFSAELNLENAAGTSAVGTPGREENEFKLSVTGSQQILNNNSYIIALMRSALERAVSNDLLWQAPRQTLSDYYIMKIGMGTFCFLDVYLDSEDGFNYRNNISYRVRYRWHSRGALIRYLLGSPDAKDFPHRCEYQLKVYGGGWEKGFNKCVETRFEYRNESFPFKADRSAPPPPWPFDEYIRPAISGKYKQHNVITTQEYASLLKNRFGLSGKIKLKPVLIVVMTRRRIHLGLPSELGKTAARLGFGSATNADQAILATLDYSEIYRPDFLDAYRYSRELIKNNSLTKRLRRRLKNDLVPVTHFTELEVEFERNIESALGYEIENADSAEKKAQLQHLKTLFMEDVGKVAQTISDAFAKAGLKIVHGQISKYQQAFRQLYPEIAHR